MRLFVLFCIFGVAIASQSQNGNTKKQPQRVVGGSDVQITEYPYMSNMEYLWFGIWWTPWCGGSLLTPRAVLSAAHCFEGDIPSQWRVRLGSMFASSGGSLHPASALILHPEYNRNTVEYDVAIVRLTTAAVGSSTIGFASIAGPRFVAADGGRAMVVGWGSLWSGGPYPENLQHVEVNIINQEICAERYAFLKSQPGFEHFPDVTDVMICSGILDQGGKDACSGDSGGPLEYNKVVVGITSWGRGCADAFYPGVNARVAPLSDWIVRHAI